MKESTKRLTCGKECDGGVCGASAIGSLQLRYRPPGPPRCDKCYAEDLAAKAT